MGIVLRIEHKEAPIMLLLDEYIEWEEWPSLAQAEQRAKALRKMGASVTIYQEV